MLFKTGLGLVPGRRPHDYSGSFPAVRLRRGNWGVLEPIPSPFAFSIPLGRAWTWQGLLRAQVWELDWQTEFDLVISEWNTARSRRQWGAEVFFLSAYIGHTQDIRFKYKSDSRKSDSRIEHTQRIGRHRPKFPGAKVKRCPSEKEELPFRWSCGDSMS